MDEELTRGQHAHRLVGFYAHPETVLSWVLYNNIIDSPEAIKYMEPLALDGRRITEEHHILITWYNLQFGTDFTEEEIQKLVVLY
jgi:hypothetical protein